ncbi:MAG: hypothetical protein JNK05_25290 [Myxococcales bacterium]|nr:hypothetical protein [Myxococcales bacterium]
MKRVIEIGGAHQAVFEDGVVEITYVGDMLAPHASNLLRCSLECSTGNHSVWCADVSKLGSFTAEARKIMSVPTEGMPRSTETSHTYLYVSGASIKTKAVLTLVMAATQLLGSIRYHTEYCDSPEAARSRGHAKMKELLAAGLAKLPG